MLMQDWWWIWCLALVIGASGCIGSFLNVVAYRLPRDLAVNKPRWSFCPGCETRIRWHDNIPIISYFRLRGRCAVCREEIPPRYVHIEALMILVAVVLFDAFFISGKLTGLTPSRFWSVAYLFCADWPIYLAYAILFACLLAMSAIDLQVYWVDIRFTRLATVVGFVAHAWWTPAHQTAWPRPGPQFGWAVLFATLGAIATHMAWCVYWRGQVDDSPEFSVDAEGSGTDAAGAPAATPEKEVVGFSPSAWLTGVVLYFTVAVVVCALIHFHGMPSADPAESGFAVRAIPAIALAFLLLVGASMVNREADEEIEDALEEERLTARRVVSIEALTLLPTVGLFIAGWMLSDQLMNAWHWSPIPDWNPVRGLATAASGFFVAGAIGWIVRICFTILFGKEAFGVGDIHLMAAAGAVIGWESVVVGYFIATLLALAGWVLALPVKRRRAMPMGPWLTLGFFIGALQRDTIIRDYIEPIRELIAAL